MTNLNRRLVVIGGGLAILGGCAAGDDVAEDGTRPKGGIGGTGIVGTLTDFGSLIVNGLRIELPRGLTVETALGRIDQQNLAIGHSLTVEAEDDGARMVARRVAIAHPVIGPIQAITNGGRLISVAGIPVQVTPDMIVGRIVGETVAVSGVWRGSAVVASRLDFVEAATQAVVAGTVRRNATDGWTIGSIAVDLPPDAEPSEGAYATATGQPNGPRFRIASYSEGRFTGAAGPLEALSVEGYLAPTAEAPFHTIDGLGHSLSADSDVTRFVGDRVLLTGSYTGLFDVEDAVVLGGRRGGWRNTLKR